MSKLYDKFLKMKTENLDKIYLFKSGIFYVALNEDAKVLANKFGLSITNLNDTVTKCGFPKTRLDFYLRLFKSNNINFQIIDSDYVKVDNVADYLESEKVKSVIHEITTIDFDNITYTEAYKKLEYLSKILKNNNIV